MYFSVKIICWLLFFLVLIVLSIVDLRTRKIPKQCVWAIFILGNLKMFIDFGNRLNYVCGFFAVSTILFILWVLSNGRLIGGGDVKMMAVCGLFLGWRLIWIAFAVGCGIGVIIHGIYMKIYKIDNSLPMGPYFSAGILAAVLYGEIFREILN